MNGENAGAMVGGQLQQQQPPLQLHMRAQVNGSTTIHVETSNLSDLARIMALFNLGGVGIEGGAAAAEQKEVGAAPKPAGRRKADSAPAPTATDSASSDTPPAQAPASAPTVAAAPTAAPTTDVPAAASTVTPQAAADAVRNFGAKNGIEKAKELLKKHGFERTADITPAGAAAIHAEATAAEEL